MYSTLNPKFITILLVWIEFRIDKISTQIPSSRLKRCKTSQAKSNIYAYIYMCIMYRY